LNNTLKLVKEVFKDEALTSERYVHVTPPGLILDILGRIDFESETKFLELKSKPINFRKGKNGLTQTIQKLPASIDDVEESVYETSCFLLGRKATGKRKHI
jgi:hypothetical protein